MKGSDFICDSGHLLYYKCHKIKFKRGRSYIESSDWTKSKSNNKSHKCFQYAATVASNYEKIRKNPVRIKKNILSYILLGA